MGEGVPPPTNSLKEDKMRNTMSRGYIKRGTIGFMIMMVSLWVGAWGADVLITTWASFPTIATAFIGVLGGISMFLGAIIEWCDQ